MDRRRFLLAATATAAPFPAAALTADEALRGLLDRLGDGPGESSTPAGAARRRLAAARRAAALGAFDAGALSPDGRVLYAGALDGSRTEAAFRQLFPFGAATGVSPYVVQPRAGAQTRGDSTAAEFDGETERIRADAARGVILPRELLSATLARLAATRPSRTGETAAALDRQAAALEDLRSRAPAEPGTWRFDRDGSYYALALSLGAGGRTDPDEAHRLGLEQVAALQSSADRLLRTQGLTRGSVGERLRALARDPRHLYPAADEGKDRAVAHMNASLRRVQSLLPSAFSHVPEAPVAVRRMSAADEAAGRAGRREAGAYIVDLIHIRDRPRWSLPSVVHHELQPGHLLQEALVERPPHPLQLRYAPGYSEGWAIYAEQLADELGAFEGDPLGRIGWLQWMLFRMGRLVADTGIHARRWSRERAIDELRELQGDSVAFITIEEDVDRISAAPGAAAGQALAALEIARLRTDARRRMGPRFDLCGFHDAVLKRGPLGGPGLAEAVRVWEAGVAT